MRGGNFSKPGGSQTKLEGSEAKLEGRKTKDLLSANREVSMGYRRFQIKAILGPFLSLAMPSTRQARIDPATGQHNINSDFRKAFVPRTTVAHDPVTRGRDR